jgi:FkbM family methyltransferase
MSSTYFILTKDASEPVDRDDNNLIVEPSTSDHQDVYILPQINVDYYRHHGLFEKALIEWSKQLCGTDWVMLDIGAHTGTYSIALANYFQHVYAFEPQKSTYYALCGSVALSNKTDKITCIHMALGTEEQSKRDDNTLKIRSLDGGGSSLFHISNDSNTPIVSEHPSIDTKYQTLSEEKIHVCTLDEMKIQNIGFIKLDVEYNELSVLQGGKRTIHQNLPKILFEVNPEDAQNKKDIFDYLTQEFNYKITAIRGVNNMYLAHM